MFDNTNLTSPEAILMLPIGLLFDVAMAIVALLGAWWGLSDYGILAWASWLIIGTWAYTRRGGIREEIQKEEKQKKEKEEPAERPSSKDKDKKIRNPKKNLKASGPSRGRLKKVIKKLPYSFLLQGIPWIGDYVVLFTFPNTRFVLRELKK